MKTRSRPAVFLDRDGVINPTLLRGGKRRAPDRVEDFTFFPGVESAVRDLREAGFLVVVVTNQPDVARGWQTRENVDAMNRIVVDRLGVDSLKACFHLDQDGCRCRKPLPGMLIEAARELDIDFARSYMLGDRKGDVEAGRSAGCLANLVVNPEMPADFKHDGEFSDLRAAADWILRSL